MKSLLKVTRRASLGLVIISELAQRFDGGETVSLEEIAEKAGASRKFLEQIAGALRKAGLITGRRGAAGGYVLARDPRKLTVAEVLDAIEGPMSLDACTARVNTLRVHAAGPSVLERIQGQVVATLMNTRIIDIA